MKLEKLIKQLLHSNLHAHIIHICIYISFYFIFVKEVKNFQKLKTPIEKEINSNSAAKSAVMYKSLSDYSEAKILDQFNMFSIHQRAAARGFYTLRRLRKARGNRITQIS